MKVSKEELDDAGEYLPDPLFDNGVVEIEGKFGTMFIDYEKAEPIFRCDLCNFKGGEYDEAVSHVKRDHGLRKRLEVLSDRLGFDDESRIERFKRVREQVPEDQRMDLLITEDTTWAKSETDPAEPVYGNSALDAMAPK